jgi:hypothetical protein
MEIWRIFFKTWLNLWLLEIIKKALEFSSYYLNFQYSFFFGYMEFWVYGILGIWNFGLWLLIK